MDEKEGKKPENIKRFQYKTLQTEGFSSKHFVVVFLTFLFYSFWLFVTLFILGYYHILHRSVNCYIPIIIIIAFFYLFWWCATEEPEVNKVLPMIIIIITLYFIKMNCICLFLCFIFLLSFFLLLVFIHFHIIILSCNEMLSSARIRCW